VRYLAGVDGGQSSTVAVVLTETGALAGRGEAGPAAHVDVPAGSRVAADAIEAALRAALAAARLSPQTELEAVRIGLSGWDPDFDGAAPTVRAKHVAFGHDAPIALAGAVASRPAVIVIAGTGSVAYGEDEAGHAVRIGGWGLLFGEPGSGFAVARDGLAAAMRADDAGRVHPLGEAALAYFDRRSLRGLATAAVQGKLRHDQLAAFARVVADAARLGDADAAAVLASAAAALAELAATTIARLGAEGHEVRVAFTGGLVSNEAFRLRVHERLHALAPSALAVTPRAEPAIGAALLAFADAGLAIPARVGVS
jgi:N-acetylglucosamine kinase-like BadF-type ATPase